MKKVTYLKDHKELGLQKALEFNKGQYSEKLVKQATEELAKAGLKYNSGSGAVSLSNSWISKPVDKGDVPVYDTVDELVEDVFANEIVNGASRLSRGFKSH